MSSSSSLPSSFGADTSRAAPRATPWRARLRRAGVAIWRALEAYGNARAQHELRALHDRWAVSDPALARQLREPDTFPVARGPT
jgi:hypothetical protein